MNVMIIIIFFYFKYIFKKIRSERTAKKYDINREMRSVAQAFS